MNSITEKTTITVPLLKLGAILIPLIGFAGLYFELSNSVENNTSDLIDLKAITTQQESRLNNSDVDRVEIQTKLVNIEALLLEIKTKVQ